MVPIRMTARSSYFRRLSSWSLLTSTTGDNPTVATTEMIRYPSWRNPPTGSLLRCRYPHHHDCHQSLQRLIFSTSTSSKNDTNSNVDGLTKKQKNEYVCKSVYRQMLRWCQNYNQQLYPPDMIQWFAKAPKLFTLNPRLFPTHAYVGRKFVPMRQLQEIGDELNHYHENPTPRMGRVLTFLNEIPRVQYNPDQTSSLMVQIQSIHDVQNCIRALYRMNDRIATDRLNEQIDVLVEDFEKSCRQAAFEEIKHMNEISVELQKCQEQRRIRLHHDFRTLERYFKDCSNDSNDHRPLPQQILPIGQVVQHKEHRWRGVIVHWSLHDSETQKHDHRANKALSNNVRDDFTSLTLKSYTKPIENADDAHENDNVSMVDSEPTTSIVYEIVLDEGNVLDHFEDSDDSDVSISYSDTASLSSSSGIMKQHLLQTHQASIPTFITVRQPLIFPKASSSNATSREDTDTVVSPTFEVMQDPHLCRIHNEFLGRIFSKYDARTKTFVPNTYMSYTYPNWHPTNNISNDNKLDATTTTNLDPNSFENSCLTENDEMDRNTTKIMLAMIEQIQSFALYLVTIIDDVVGDEKQFSTHREDDGADDTSMKNQYSNQNENQLMGVLTDIRSSFNDMATLDTISVQVRDALPLSELLSIQLRAMEILAVKIRNTMYTRRLKEIIDATKTTQQHSKESTKFTPKFHLGQIVRHKKYKYRGVIAERDNEPIYNVSRWAGLRKIPHANELPFYKLIPDQQDCIEIFGGVRPERYVCEENLEPCPPDDMYLDVDVDADWIKLPDGSYRPSPLDRFIYGYDSDECDNSDVRNEYNTFEKCMTALDSAINQWHCDCVRNVLLQPQTLSDDDVDTATDAVPPSVARKYAISIHDMIKLLKVADRLNATPIRESIKLFGKAHPNIQLRTQLQYSIELMGADNFEKARTILRSIVTDGDPLYIDAWNHLANSETFLSLKNDAMASANMALQLNSDDFHAFTQLGILHFQKGEYSKAEIYFRKRLDFDPWSIVSLKLSELIDLMKD